jgi:phosphoglycerol transferase MdoB-like AlkP superfamily enzyme
MKSRIVFYLKFILFLIIIQFFFRLLFLLYYGDQAEHLSLEEAWQTYRYGFRHDASLTGYVLIIPTILLALFSFARKDHTRKWIHIYSIMILVIFILAYMNNLVVYQFWNYPIDKSIFDYVDSPKEWLANTKTISFIVSLVIFLLFLMGLFFLLRNYITNNLKNLTASWPSGILFILILPLLIFPIRGSSAVAPLNTGSVFFHKDDILNHAAVNPLWNLFYSVGQGNKLSSHFNFIAEQEAGLAHDSLYHHSGIFPDLLNDQRPNLVIIIMESFGADIISDLGGNPQVTPEFNRLTDKGIFFNNFYSTGPMTDRALAGVLSGYPAFPGRCIIHYKKKSQSLPFISKDLRSEGYSTTFIYGGDINFAHMKSYLMTGGFERIISNNNGHFPDSIERTKWGIPDEFTFKRLLDECDSAVSPFFMVLLTLSNHNPFNVPMEPVFPGNDYKHQFYNAAFYSDKCLGEFVTRAEHKEWYRNTLLIILGDHGTRIGNTTEYDSKRFSVPMLWMGGALKVNGIRYEKYGSQTDLPGTLLNQMGIPADYYTFSKNLFDIQSASFAFYSFQNGFGILGDSVYLVYQLPTDKFVREEGPDTSRWKKPGLAYIQYIASDFEAR